MNGLELYTRTSTEAAARVIRAYSTSFGMAANLLPPDRRRGIRNIYALVRTADEIVDGTAAEAGLTADQQRSVLDALEQEVLLGTARGFSANPVVHAFAVTAREADIETPLITAFFHSMRRDLSPVERLSRAQYEEYVYGSAEVVGLMCLRVFLNGHAWDAERLQPVEHGAARLGAAFQKINFLRDLGDDATQLGRAYFPGALPGQLSEREKADILDEIDEDLAAAKTGIAQLPPGPRRATLLAAQLFEDVTAQLRRTPAAEILHRRVSVPRRRKTYLMLKTLLPANFRGRP